MHKNKINRSKLHSLIRQNSIDQDYDASVSKLLDQTASNLKSGIDLTVQDSGRQEDSHRAIRFSSPKAGPRKPFAAGDLLKIGSTWMTELKNQVHNYKQMVEYKRDEQNRKEDYAVEVVLKKYEEANIVAPLQPGSAAARPAPRVHVPHQHHQSSRPDFRLSLQAPSEAGPPAPERRRAGRRPG